MATCFCTGACRDGRGCAAYPRGTTPGQFIGRGSTYREPLTEEQVRRIVREEIERSGDPRKVK